ncbi:MAG: hypothetical protein EON58_22250 [Alphaproteobacteria bacterium]|nr:MAG: hypothetical protein EON58_22250 [Alphaproteobacteria bacterium]
MTCSARFAIVSLLLILPVVAGCQPQYGGNTNTALGIPESGKVRVVATSLEAGANRLHYKWSFIGGTNWRKATAAGTDFALSDTYPMNSAKERGGCNVYEADLQADKTTGKWKTILHGSDGTTVSSEGALPDAGVESIRIQQDAPSAVKGLPARLTLAQIDGKPLRIQIAR